MYTLAFVAVVFLVSGIGGFLTARNIYKKVTIKKKIRGDDIPTDYESWYRQQVEKGFLPDKNGYYHCTSFTNEKKTIS